MGLACCIAAARDGSTSNRTAAEAMQRSILYSPSWSFRWDNRRRVAGEIENIRCESSHGIYSNNHMRVKKTIRSASRGDLVENSGASPCQSLKGNGGVDANSTTPSSEICTDTSMASNYSEMKRAAETLGNAMPFTPKLSFSTPMPSSFSTPTPDHLSLQYHAIPPSSTPSRRPPHSPGRQLRRQISDSRILKLKSPHANSASDRRSSSSALSSCSGEFVTGSQGSFSDRWSMQTFSELVDPSQRQRWSFESLQSSDRLSCSISPDRQSCMSCRLLTDSYSIVAVLVCGHLFHAECLERLTKEADKYDPVCPICIYGEKRASKMSKKASRAEARRLKVLKNRVADSCISGDLDFADQLEGKVPKLEASSSLKKPFITRHFSLGAKWARSFSENHSTRKKGFWSRYSKN